VRDEVPPEYKPGSPTPFEIGIRGIIKSLDDLARTPIALPGVTEELGDITKGVNETFTESDAPDDAEQLGEDILTGLAESMTDNIAQAVRAGQDAIEEVIGAMEDAAETDSPSRRTMELGSFLDTGLMFGMERGRGPLLRTAAGLADMVIAQFDTDWSVDAGVDSVLGIIQGLDEATPDLLNRVMFLIGGMQTAMADALADGNHTLADSLEQNLDTLLGIVENFSGQVSDALASAYEGIADINRSLADTDLSDFSSGVQDRVRRELTQAEQEASQIADPREAADYYEFRRKQIMEMAQLEQEANDVIWKEAERLATEHKKITDDLDKQQGKVESDRDKDVAALQEKLLKATSVEQRQEIQAQIDERTKAADAELKLIKEARDAESARHMQATRDSELERAETYARYMERIELIKKAQEAERKAFEERQSQQGSNVQGLIETIRTLIESMEGQGGAGPIIQLLQQLLGRLTSIPGMASGGAMRAMQPYLVGERGPELVVPGATSYILAAQQTRRELRMAPERGNTTTTYGGLTIQVDARGSSLSEAAITRAVMAGVNRVANSADLRIRMGVG
jgi:hypothetical protein